MTIEIDFTRANDLQYVQSINRAVADQLFPQRTFSSMALKMYSEMGEVVDDPASPEEVADVLIMLLDHMDRIGAHAGHEIMKKLEKNLNRDWAYSPVTKTWSHRHG